LGSNKIGDAGADALSEALDKVKKLNLYDSNITGEGVKAIGNQLKTIPYKIRKETYCGVA